MPGNESALRPLKLELFFPLRESLSQAERLRRLIELRASLVRDYGDAYGGLANTLATLRAGGHPSIAQMTPEQRTELEEQLVSSRDQVARGFTQMIRRAESDANEIMPGVFPRDAEPFQSFDLGEWLDKILEGLINILRGLGDIFGAFGWETGEKACDFAAEALEEARRWDWDSDSED